ncbi:MAG: uncharacterized protein KVP18_000815 [Porospora cf. gigantea A]|uniref:uncharacterized protein n=1 Tax=Porospora cf. gigantea A TaxID=2853593 RepID=UPI00355A8757|nr:MAG: hypothetical protein KVP18_000815 [Porospora cf. gigantea A]
MPEQGYATGWLRVDPPQGHDVLLPSWMAGQYKLYLPDVDDHNHAIDWKFQYWKGEGTDDIVQIPQESISADTKFERPVPGYLTSSGIEGPARDAYTTDTFRPARSPKEYMVFHMSGEDSKTVVQVRDVLIETAPRATVTVATTDLYEWLSRPGHSQASDLGNAIPTLKGIYTLYADVAPHTRVWAEDHALEFEDHVKVKFARASYNGS